MLVLCGSQVSFMEKEVLAERSPLFGRRTGQRRLSALSPLEALEFFPRWKMKDRVLAYAVLGGMPAYLRRFDDRKSLRENLLSELLRQERLVLVESIALDAPKTKAAKARLAELGVERGLIVVEAFDENLWLATRNLPDVSCLAAGDVDPVSLVASDRIIMTAAAAKLIEGRLG